MAHRYDWGRRMPPADPRDVLQLLVEEKGETLAGLSRWLGRSPGYLRGFVHEGTPEALPEPVRDKLSRYFGIDVALLARDLDE
jgi:hypothetical protein